MNNLQAVSGEGSDESENCDAQREKELHSSLLRMMLSFYVSPLKSNVELVCAMMGSRNVTVESTPLPGPICCHYRDQALLSRVMHDVAAPRQVHTAI